MIEEFEEILQREGIRDIAITEESNGVAYEPEYNRSFIYIDISNSVYRVDDAEDAQLIDANWMVNNLDFWNKKLEPAARALQIEFKGPNWYLNV